MNEVMKPLKSLLMTLVMALLLTGCGESTSAPPLQGARMGGPFTLTSQDGSKVSDSDFAGKYRLIYFGYSFCPDVCPVDLLAIGQGLIQFEKSDPARGARVQPIFISIDPERDTPTVLKPYVAAFHPRLIGLTGSAGQVKDVAKRYGVYYEKRDESGATEYLMDHSRQAVLFGPDGDPLALVPQDEGAKAVVEVLDKWVK
jgi:protein SCO1/2